MHLCEKLSLCPLPGSDAECKPLQTHLLPIDEDQQQAVLGLHPQQQQRQQQQQSVELNEGPPATGKYTDIFHMFAADLGRRTSVREDQQQQAILGLHPQQQQRQQQQSVELNEGPPATGKYTDTFHMLAADLGRRTSVRREAVPEVAAVSVGQEFWIVAVGCSKGQGVGSQSEKDGLLAELKRQSSLTGNKEGPQKFEVPDGERSLLFGSFDNLISLTDDLAKSDSSVDGIVHRLERQTLELDPKAEFKVKSQRQEKPFVDYLRTWQWDEAKYPKTRSIQDILTFLMSVVNKLDEEARNKTAQYNEFKTQKGNMSKKDGANLAGKDLLDVLTPDVVKCTGGPDDDFIMTEYVTTVPVIIPRGQEEDFLKFYESTDQYVAPMSARKFEGMDDNDGNSLWRVVMFRSAVDVFKKACREKRFLAKDFEYSEEAYKKLQVQRATLEESVKRQHELVRGLYQAAWSDVMVAWMHIKAMRVFVESVLRFGMPPRFASFVLCPKATATTRARKALSDILGKQAGTFSVDDKTDSRGEDSTDDDEFFPYVSLSLTPFTCVKEK
ncbi:unnamed protein product [Polarella glacialis]|uniref:V-type proton ATPase subunit C n=1 Tax=Polarella glacialis TaxID=89957 RepID=A0A813HXA9_POLGL|nr:unnamed protein product [Polarella glacialis]